MVVLDILVVIYGWSFSQPLESYCGSWLGCLNHLYSLVQGIIRGSRYVSMTKSNSHIPFCKAIASLPPHPHCRCYTHSLCLNSSHHSLWTESVYTSRWINLLGILCITGFVFVSFALLINGIISKKSLTPKIHPIGLSVIYAKKRWLSLVFLFLF